MNAKQLRELSNVFNGYRHPVTDERIQHWINQFANTDVAIAERILKNVNFYTGDRIAASFRAALVSLDGWHIDPSIRRGKWRFVPYSTSAGESGDTMVHKFRNANGLSNRKYNELFIYPSTILKEKLGPDDSIVFIDDFIGSGDQATTAWAEIFGELLADVGQVYLLVVSGCKKGIERVRDETELSVVSGHVLPPSSNIFGTEAKWSSEDKERLLTYCKKASKSKPKGHGDCGLLVVFAHSCPNNSIAVLHAQTEKWEPLFRRYD